ncbi:MAG: hypothetical protein HY002_14825 [Candidatus Rokubacteria bacterium]|nr:hypothetical protein [Candidatus Rokubacteria bacterium]
MSYDDVIHRLALERQLVPPATPVDKNAVRDGIRRRGDGDFDWQWVQATVYGSLIDEASLHEGVAAFFRVARAAGVRVYVVSHKTEVASVDPHGVNLRVAALGWMERHGFFAPDGLGLAREDVYFEPTRAAKIARVAALGCTHFIDDLEETFRETDFPDNVEKILFAPHGRPMSLPGVRVVRSWREITGYLFGE